MGKDAKMKRLKTEKKFNATDERDKRLTQAALNSALAVKQCSFCATIGAWNIYNIERSRGRVRYIKCKACGHNASLPLIKPEDRSAGIPEDR